MADNNIERDVEFAKEAIFWRGLFVNRYAAFEFAIAELVSRGFAHKAYSHLGEPPFGPAKKLKRLRQMIDLAGPFAAYRADLLLKLDELAQYADHRHFMVHAMMVARSGNTITFHMYDHRGGTYGFGELLFEMEHLETLAKAIGPVSNEFAQLVSRMCREIPLPSV
jgi:hypothetical protein